MKKTIVFLLCCASMLSCKQEKNLFNIEAEPLSVDAAVKVSAWIGYNDFSYELKRLTDHFYEEKTIQNNGKLLSASQAVLYSMPNDLRNETMNERAAELVDLTKTLYNGLANKSEAEMTQDIQNLVNAYKTLNKEINYYTNN